MMKTIGATVDMTHEERELLRELNDVLRRWEGKISTVEVNNVLGHVYLEFDV